MRSVVIVSLVLVATVSALSGPLAQHAKAAFKALDGRGQGQLAADAVDAEALKVFFPGVTQPEFTSFLQASDANGDGVVSEQEFVSGVAEGVSNVQFLRSSAPQSRGDTLGRWRERAEETARRGADVMLPSLLEAEAQADPTPVKKVEGGAPAAGAPAAAAQTDNKINTADDGCVICQYIVERAETNIKQSGVIPSITGAEMGPVMLQVGEQQEGETALLQTEQSPFDIAAAKVIGATRQSTQYQRQLERQKYNEIYRVMDITLDDVCEQSMPGPFYPHCKAVYKAQADIVDGLRYQYKPADICFKISMCSADSYITRGIHSRYKVMMNAGAAAAPAGAAEAAVPKVDATVV